MKTTPKRTSASTNTTNTNTSNEASSQTSYTIFSFRGICVMIVLSIIISNILVTRQKHLSSLYLGFEPINSLTYAFYHGPGIVNKLKGEDHLSHVKNILDRMGFRQVDFEADWDLLWAHEYPFKEENKYMLQNLNRSQLVNHVPGSGYLTNKVDLCTSGSKYLPKAFRLPKQKTEFLSFQADNPKMLFVEKNNNHRQIFIKPANEIDLSSEKTFIQEFIDHPYLVDGYKFDIGVYVVLTSINPLRVYIYTGDYAFRFCPEQYYPFDPKNINKYVVADNYLPMWKVPSLTEYFNTFKFSYKDSFDAYVQKNKQDPKVIWNQIEEIVRHTILDQENNIMSAASKYKGRNFFELMRFDLIVDKDLRVYLMEANMSPNLSSGHFKQNAVYFEQIIYNVMQLLGVGSSINREDFQKQTPEVEAMISSDKNIATDANKCLKNLCNDDCNKSACSMCINCMSENDLEVLHDAYREHIRRAETKRIFPKPITNLKEYKIEQEIKGLTPANEMITRWFYEKCKVDSTWCT